MTQSPGSAPALPEILRPPLTRNVALLMRGPVTLQPSDGLREEYRRAAARVLGPSAGEAWCRSLEGRGQVAIRLAPRWAAEWDMYRSPFLAEAED